MKHLADFIPGLELSRCFFADCVQPILAGAYPDLQYSAGRIGAGSDVLGFDDPMSMDHDWGPQVQVFLTEESQASLARPVGSIMRSALPSRFRGLPTCFVDNDDGTQTMGRDTAGHPKVEFLTWTGFLEEKLGLDVRVPPKLTDWLVIPEQALLELTQGEFFRDDLGLSGIRQTWTSHPDDVWHFVLAGQWERVAEEEHLVGRAGYAGDEIGAKLIAACLVRDLMRIGFMMERRYTPYPKWFGSAYAKLSLGPEMVPLLDAVLRSEGWEARDAALAAAFEKTADHHNRRGLTEPIPESCAPFYGRPFRVFHLHAKVADRLVAQIRDPELAALALRRRIGSIDTFSDCTALLCDVERRAALRGLFETFDANTPKSS